MKAIHVLRKPLVGTTVAGNVLKFGCGGLNIDAARVETVSAGPGSTENGRDDALFGGGIVSRPAYDGSKGRWPANVVFQHLDGCEQTGVRSVRTSTATNKSGSSGGMFGVIGASAPGTETRGLEAQRDGTETVAAYDCEAGCPVAALDAQSGVSTSTGGRASIGAFKGGRAFGVGNEAEVLPGVQPGLGDTGGPHASSSSSEVAQTALR